MNFSLNIHEPVKWIIENSFDIDLKWNKKQIEEHFSNKKSFNIFYKDGNVLRGVILAHEIFDDNQNYECEILHLGVMKNYRKMGVGFQLMQFLEKKICLNGKITSIFLEVSKQNKIAIKLYQKLGYKSYRERKNYYKNLLDINAIGESAILLKKIINE